MRTDLINRLDERGQEFVHAFSRWANVSKEHARRAAEALASDHRSLQQNMFRFAMVFVQVMAEKAKTKDYDLRNEASVMLAKRIVDTFGYDLEALPFV